MNLTTQSKQLQDLLGLKWPPISITFRKEVPVGIPRISESAPSGCTYWKLAAEGQVFYTEASDHFGCPIGAYTHGVSLPPAQSKELEGMIETMVGLSYLKMEEVPSIPHREDPFGVAVYAPLADTPFQPDVVVVRGNAKQMMLLAEAVNAAGVGSAGGIMGRPTCTMIPAVIKTQQTAISLGCIGNRVYNELSDEEFYTAMAEPTLTEVMGQLKTVVAANNELETFHRSRRAYVDGQQRQLRKT
ncbi:MAG: hypothetical protein QOG23_1778 [Blastocatellia bacterium]|jgi:uncharacterized protein (DUF169 family)|nr:hypothetical protein [Blastocatellia bacterium]